jgi:ATP-dependent DNA ligase
MMNTMLGGTAAIRARGLQRAEPLSSGLHSTRMALAIPLETPPMEARLTDEIPDEKGWQFEPKWDGFRCLAFRDGKRVELQSKSGKPLARYFPEIVEALAALAERRFVLDGELVLPEGETLSFAALQMRLHPAASRIAKLSRETPAQLMLFDCLQLAERTCRTGRWPSGAWRSKPS